MAEPPKTRAPSETPTSRLLNARLGVRVLITTVVALAAALLVDSAGGLGRWNRGFADLWVNLHDGPAPEHVGIVAIDRDALLAHQDEPLVTWGPHIAKVIDTLREVGVSLVVIDIHFGVSVEDWLGRMDITATDASTSYDAPLRRAISRGGVLLVGAVEGQEMIMPRADLLYSLPNTVGDVGLANLVQDPDGVVRSMMPALDARTPPPRLTIGTLAATRFRGWPADAPSWTFGDRTIGSGPAPVPIRWFGPPGTFPSVSFQRLLEPGALDDPAVQALAGRVVILGSRHFGLHDFHLTPYASSLFRGARQFMSGAEIQANIIETLLSGQAPTPVSPGVRWVFAFVFVMLAAIAVHRWPPLWGTLVTLLLFVVVALTAWLAFRQGRVLPVGAAQLGIGVAFVSALVFRLTGERRRRREIVRTFGRYVSHEVVERLALSGRTPDLGGEMVPLTVLFMDIRSFTTISERLNAQEVVTMLNAFFTRAVEPILDHGGMVNNYLGDGMLALFGSPVAHPDHAERAVRAALELDRVARAFPAWMNEHLPGRDIPNFAIGIGVHTGEAVTGNVGSEKRMQFTAIGDTVNTAARVESATVGLGIRIGITRATCDAVQVPLKLGPSAAVSVKGRAEPVEIHELLGLETPESV